MKLSKSNIKSLVVVGFALAMAFGGAISASAQVSTSTLVSQIQSLLVQIQTLQAQLEAINTQRGVIVSDLRQTIQLTRQLVRGASGEEVTTLQEILATDPSVYPEGLITGFFGPLTENAVRKFQAKHGIDQIGEVGPKTRTALLSFVSGISTSTAGLPPGLARKLNVIGTTTASMVPGATITICHMPPGNPNNKQTLIVGAPALSAHLAHGDTLGACEGAVTPSPATTTPDTVAPVISSVSASTTASTSAVVSWDTDESADSTVWYGTANPLATSTATKLVSETLKTSHALSLSGLTADTTYYYIVGSTDASGNEAISGQNSFTTPSE